MAKCVEKFGIREGAAAVDDELDHVPLFWRREEALKLGEKSFSLTEGRPSCVRDAVVVKEEEERRFYQEVETYNFFSSSAGLSPRDIPYWGGDRVPQTMEMRSLAYGESVVGPESGNYEESGGRSGPVLDSALGNTRIENQDDGWSDELDHIPLVTRRQMLVLKNLLPRAGSSERCMAEENGRMVECNHNDVKDEALSPSLGVAGDSLIQNVFGKEKDGSVPICSANGENSSLAMGSLSIKTSVDLGCQQSEETLSNSLREQGHVSLEEHKEPSATSMLSKKIKIEPSDHDGIPSSVYNALSDVTFKTFPLKSDLEILHDLQDDKLDHMRLQKRATALPPRLDSFKVVVPPVSPAPKIALSDAPAFQMMLSKRPRKRKKTATDSVETAMEEDAPGLLKVLLDMGISVDDIKLYGEPESGDLLDESCSSTDDFAELEEVISKPESGDFLDESYNSTDDFAELEEVISKLFPQRQSVLKFGLLTSSQDSKASYCLACLFSLVEQARHLRVRKWPVEWGWCRDLQSFIFVFERHKRIVLERPEYGYATYFFELIDSLPIDWQIKRLVTAMKLTTSSRLTLLENRALLIGEDLTEGEAKVLMEYGWIPNTGLATMLNYCDRVVHDRKNERDASEWRAKIGRLLMDGYNGGTFVLSNVPKKASDWSLEMAQVKMEPE